ncbi:MAG: SAM-dependent methyltransferase [Alphaproteobacteria bacterium]|nr:SAM-dependent methyltransferase [Alphaproteobacteria bacterium]
MNSLETIIHNQIMQHGPMDIGQFMAMALSHPKHGYYVSRDPIGSAGDFVTAPEISQMFGEVVGAWAAHSWVQMGAPEAFVLLECGPGRGTLMADVMRACAGIDGFCDAAQVHLIEVSPELRAKQGEVLAGYDPIWHDGLGGVSDDLPILVIANEFMDALPFRQLIYLDGAWHERVVSVKEDALVFTTRPAPEVLWPQFGSPHFGGIYEFSAPRLNFVDAVCARLKAHHGAALLIDYGHASSAFGDTFQAVKGHEFADVLSNVGDVDLTSHVDFEPLYEVAKTQGCIAQPLMEQGDFLRIMGIEARAAYLAQKGAKGIEADLMRLIDVGEMGALFKVMDVRYGF